MRKLPSNPKSMVPFVVLESATPTSITAMLEHVPVYGPTEWRRLVENAIGAIHQIPRVLKSKALPNLDLKDVEAYFGRSSSGADIIGKNLYGRFRTGFMERGHTFGMVFAQTSIAATLRFERFAISLINQLKDRDGLCISNRTLAPRGNVGDTEPGYLYMTFTLVEGDEHARVLSQREVDEAVADVIDEFRRSAVTPVKAVHENAARIAVSIANDVQFIGEHRIALTQ